MAATYLTRLRWHAARLARALGPAGLLGAALVAVAALGVVLVLGPTRAQVARVEAEADATARAELRRPAPAPVTSAADRLANFESGFVDEREIPGALARLLQNASKQRLRIDQAEFKLTSESGQPLQRYAIALPARGDYRSLRRFVEEALREQPGLAMEELSLRRAEPRAAALDAQIGLVLFVRKPAAPVAPSVIPAVLPPASVGSLRDRPLAMR